MVAKAAFGPHPGRVLSGNLDIQVGLVVLRVPGKLNPRGAGAEEKEGSQGRGRSPETLQTLEGQERGIQTVMAPRTHSWSFSQSSVVHMCPERQACSSSARRVPSTLPALGDQHSCPS